MSRIAGFERSFSRLSLPRQIGNLSMTVRRIADSLERHESVEGSREFVKEAMWFIEWCGLEFEFERMLELKYVQRDMAGWLKIWDHIWTDDLERQKVQTQARAWAEKLLGWMEELQARG